MSTQNIFKARILVQGAIDNLKQSNQTRHIENIIGNLEKSLYPLETAYNQEIERQEHEN